MAEAEEGRPSETAEHEVNIEMSPMTDASLTQADKGGPSGAMTSTGSKPEIKIVQETFSSDTKDIASSSRTALEPLPSGQLIQLGW